MGKIELTCQQMWDADNKIVKIESVLDNYYLYSAKANENNIHSNRREYYACISRKVITIIDLPAFGIATKPVDEREWIGKPCWFWNNSDDNKLLDILHTIDTHGVCKLYRGLYYGYDNCKPATKEEVLEWFEENRGDNGN